MKKKKVAKKAKKIVVTLSERDFEKLSSYAKSQGKSRSIIAKRMLKTEIASLAVEKQKQASKNQLGLFDSMQIDIFNGVSKTVD